jgi:hydrogenase-4 component B
MSEQLILLGIIIAATSGVPGLVLSRYSTTGQCVTTVLAVIAAVLGLSGITRFWTSGDSQEIVLAWSVPGGEFNVSMDGLSALFLLPVFLVSLLGNIYGLSYWKQTEHADNGRQLRFFYGLLTAGMALLVIARNSMLFLVGWEVMALSAFFLVTTEDDQQDVREAGWIYLVATHVATLFLFGLFGLLYAVNGSLTLAPLNEEAVTPGMAWAIFVVALVGFGLKAGIMPLHIWLPSSHAIAPSHVSAIMSGVLIKMGIYGIVRITSLFPHPPLEWGGTLLALGAVSGVLGVAFAIGQHDLKRLLAYHSIENIGIIIMGIGLALVGRSVGRAEWIILGLGGGLLHVWNHALFKALLFLSAGSVIHAVHTREIDHLGGLAKAMPRTALCFLVGAVAICGLPPLNGFVSEFLIYLGLFDTLGIEGGPSCAGAAFGAPALALIGALAVACFVKVFGAVFLGTARSEHAQHAHESRASMIGPMALLVICCFSIGLASPFAAPVLGQGVSSWAPEFADKGPDQAMLAPLEWISILGVVLVVALVLASAALWLRLRGSVVQTGPTWGCGYLAPTPRMQYTSSSFAQLLVGLFDWVLRPRTRAPCLRSQAYSPFGCELTDGGSTMPPSSKDLGLFPQKTDFCSAVPDTVLDEAVLPTFRIGARLFSRLRMLQQGSIQTYVLYIFLALLGLLLWR